jgi:general stress protein 26
MKELNNRIIKLFSESTLVNLGTVSPDSKPWVRAMMAKADENGNIVMATFKGSRKVQHLASNNEVHIAFGGTSETPQYFQIQGKALVTETPELKQKFWSPMLSAYFKDANDPGYALIIVEPYKMEVFTMGQNAPEILE